MGIATPRNPGLRRLIGDTAVCAECLAWRTGMRPGDVYESLQAIATLEPLTTDIGRCTRCLREKVVHRIG